MNSLQTTIWILTVALSATRAQEGPADSSSTAGINCSKYWIIVDEGLPLLNHAGHGWQPSNSFRGAIGVELAPSLAACIHVDYYVNTLADEGGFYGLVPHSTKRYDLALYGGFILAKIFEVGLGAYHNNSQQIIEYHFGQLVGNWAPSGSSSTNLFVLGGIGYQFTILGKVIVPLGIFFRNQAYGDNSGSNMMLRAGLGYRF